MFNVTYVTEWMNKQTKPNSHRAADNLFTLLLVVKTFTNNKQQNLLDGGQRSRTEKQQYVEMGNPDHM